MTDAEAAEILRKYYGSFLTNGSAVYVALKHAIEKLEEKPKVRVQRERKYELKERP